MHKMKEPKYVAATLKWCNERRKERGKKPLNRLPMGKKWDGRSCPCGKATGLWVFMGEWKSVDGLRKGLPTKDVDQFIYNFDAGRLPQYELCKK